VLLKRGVVNISHCLIREKEGRWGQTLPQQRAARVAVS